MSFGIFPSASNLKLHLRRSLEHHLLTGYCLLPTVYYTFSASILTSTLVLGVVCHTAALFFNPSIF